MYISAARINNYKSIYDSGDIPFAPRFNVIVGRNDAGKSALVEALGLRYALKPHRSLKTALTAVTPLEQISSTHITFNLSPEDIIEFLSGQQLVYIPVTAGEDQPVIDQFTKAIAEAGTFQFVWTPNGVGSAWLERYGDSAKPNFLQCNNSAYPYGLNLVANGRVSGSVGHYGLVIAGVLLTRIYGFRAERLNVGESNVTGNAVLLQNAANLPDVLNQLISSNPVRFERLMSHVRTIFPHVTQITAPIVNGPTARIMVWSVPPESERADLAVPLAESGTGIGQVLAILYVVVNATSSQVVIIDEPQSFLHPGAVRKLLEILRQYSQHQYIITTHAPVALTAMDADCLLLARREEQETRIERIDPNRQQDLRMFLTEVGARLGDVFGADTILWVEGKTEESCFPEIIRRLAGLPLRGVQVLGVINTGDLEAKHASRVIDIYTRLSGGASLLPPALAFVFDTDGRSQRERDDMVRRSGGLISWLPLRMFENYLIEPPAIVSVLNREDDTRENPITLEQIKEWLHKHSAERRYFADGNDVSTYGSDKWKVYVHGSHILHELFVTLTDNRIAYDKLKHGLMLSQLLIDQPTDDMRGLAQMLGTIVKRTA